MNKVQKNICIASLILLIISTVWSFVGSVLMLLDYRSGGYYSYHYSQYIYYHYNKPETGIMAFIGFVLLLVATILFCVSLRKRYKLAIGTIILTIFGEILLFASVIFVIKDSIHISVMGYVTCCIPAGVIAFATTILSIVYVLSFKKQMIFGNGNEAGQNNKTNQNK